jgi:dihydroxyacetone kinase
VPTFELDEGEMEIGIGIHGERGIERLPLASADEVGRDLARRVCAEAVPGAPLAVMVNSLGATSLEELYIVYGSIAAEVAVLGFEVERVYVGRYATSMEMAGMSLTVLSLDERLRELLAAPARSPFFCEHGVELGHG